ncbi:MAG: protoporphyrinogen/coproporphyrinogen oxidase [Myxococcota bacterium]
MSVALRVDPERAARRAVVAGAGVSGLAAALDLRRRGWEVEILEASDGPGGLVRPFRFRGRDCDLGSHRLHPEATSDPILAEMADEIGLAPRRRRGRIVLNRRQVPYPLTLPGLLHGLGARTSAAFCAGYLGRRRDFARWEADRARPPRDDDEGFEAFVLRRVGRAAYEGFYRPYVEKVWGLEPDRLSRSVAKKRVSTSRPGAQVARALVPGRGADATFLYPRGGMASMLAWLRRSAADAGVTFRYGARVGTGGLSPDDLDADAVVMAGRLGDLAPRADLAHRGLYLVFLALDTDRLGATDTYYVPEGHYWFGRVSEVRNFSEALARPGETVVCCEIPEGRWGRGRDFTRRAPEILEQLREAGIAPPGVRVLEAAQRWVPDVYPLYTRGWLARWAEAMDQVTASGRVVPVGRQGLYLHCNIDHCLRTARDAAAHLSRGGDARTWRAETGHYLGLRVRD